MLILETWRYMHHLASKSWRYKHFVIQWLMHIWHKHPRPKLKSQSYPHTSTKQCQAISRHSDDWKIMKHFYQIVLTIHYSDVIMGTMVSQITSLTIVYSTIYSGADQRKHQSSTSLAFLWGTHRWPVNSPVQMTHNVENVSIWWCHHEMIPDRLCWRHDIIFKMTNNILQYAPMLQALTQEDSTHSKSSLQYHKDTYCHHSSSLWLQHRKSSFYETHSCQGAIFRSRLPWQPGFETREEMTRTSYLHPLDIFLTFH